MEIAIKKLEGRDHYVVPMVMITVGVHSGSNGPVYYPPDELERSVPYWNAKPVVVYHPAMYGSPWAGNPDVFDRQKIGTVFNAKFDGHRLKADAWIDVARVGQVDRRIEQTIKSRQMMEVSTGLSFDRGIGAGVWNGHNYHTTACRMVPDHLAVLPEGRGACSVADGAGLVRNVGVPAVVASAAHGSVYAPAAHAYAYNGQQVTNGGTCGESPLVMCQWNEGPFKF